MLSYYVIYSEKFRKVLQRTDKVALNLTNLLLVFLLCFEPSFDTSPCFKEGLALGQFCRIMSEYSCQIDAGIDEHIG